MATRKSCAEEMALRPSRKPRILVGDAVGDGVGERVQHGVDGGRDRASGHADDDGEDGEEGGAGERDQAGVDEDLVVGQVARGEEQRGGEDDGGGAEIEHALDGVDGDLRADGKLHALGDQRGTDDIGQTAEEGDSGETDELQAYQRKQRDLLGGGEEDRPARRSAADRWNR